MEISAQTIAPTIRSAGCQPAGQQNEAEVDGDFATVGRLELSGPDGLNAKGKGEIAGDSVSTWQGRETGQTVDRVNLDLFG